MTTTKATTNELPPLEISPLYSDCTIQVPLDDRSGFHTYNLHLCMLCESSYFEKVVPNPIQVHPVPTLKSHFEIILRYIYHRHQIYYNDDNILDLITEGYRFSLDRFVDQLWSVFASTATARMVIDALKRMENQHEFHRSWDRYYLQTAIKRNILSIMDMIDELKSFSSVQLLLCSAGNQNPDAIFKKVLHWVSNHQGTIYMGIVQILYDTRVGRYKKKNDCSAKPNHLFSARQFSKDIRCYKREISLKVPLPCVIDTTVKFAYGDLTIQSISPLKVIFCPTHYDIRKFIFRLWDKERTFYITKWGKGKLEYDIMNALEWATQNKLQFEVIKCDDNEIESNHISNNTSVEVSLTQLPAFNYPTNREKLSDFTVECKTKNGLVEYKLHKFILRQSPYFQKIFSAANLIEPKISRTTVEKPKHLFEIILRYLYNQQPLKGITGIITDVILEASYFELNDFENELWPLFEREADVTNCIKAINLIDENTPFKIHQPNIMKRVSKNIKAVLLQINEVPDWLMVRTILTLECTKKQNPLLILKSVKQWCKIHEPKNCEGRVHEIFSEVIKSRSITKMIAKELVAKYPYLTDVKAETPDYNITETFLIHEGNSIRVQKLYPVFGEMDVGVSKSGTLTRKGLKGEELRLHDQLSSHYIVVHNGTDLNQVVENIEEWKYGGRYRISITCLRPLD